jgi:hypothetical protein
VAQEKESTLTLITAEHAFRDKGRQMIELWQQYNTGSRCNGRGPYSLASFTSRKDRAKR